MTLYKRTCCYRDLGGDLQSETQEFDELTKDAALVSSENYFYSKYAYLAKDRLLLSSIKAAYKSTNLQIK